MSDAEERVRTVLEEHGRAARIRRFDVPMPSALAAAEQLGCEPLTGGECAEVTANTAIAGVAATTGGASP